MTVLALGGDSCYWNGGTGHPTALTILAGAWATADRGFSLIHFEAGDTITFKFDSSTYNGGTAGYPVNGSVYDTVHSAFILQLAFPTEPQATPFLVTGTIPTTGDWQVSVDTYISATGYCFVGLEADIGSASYCPCGAEANPDATITWEVTSAVIDLVCAAALAASGQLELLPFVEVALAAIEGGVYVGMADCSTVPPAGGTPLDLSNPATWNPADLKTWFMRAAFNYFCQCTPCSPGGPNPPLPPPPLIVAPPGTDVTTPPVSTTCENTDICAFLTHIEKLLMNLQRNTTTLQVTIQPNTYALGTCHTGLTDAGQFAVKAIRGISVSFTGGSSTIGTEAGDPPTIYDAGWINVGDSFGFRSRHRITTNPWTLIPEQANELTEIGYSLNPLITATICELIPAQP